MGNKNLDVDCRLFESVNLIKHCMISALRAIPIIATYDEERTGGAISKRVSIPKGVSASIPSC